MARQRKPYVPKPLTSDEREAMATFFEAKAVELEKVFNGCRGMMQAYPGLYYNGLFSVVHGGTEEAMKNARLLADAMRTTLREHHWELTIHDGKRGNV